MIAFLIKIWGLARPYRGRLLLGILTGIIAGLLEPLAIAVFTFVFQLIFTPDAATFSGADIKDLPALVARLNQPPDEVSKYLVAHFSEGTKQKLAAYQVSNSSSNSLKNALVAEFYLALMGPTIYEPARFNGVTLSKETQELVSHPPSDASREQLNRLLLQDAYPRELAPGRHFQNVPSFIQPYVPDSVLNWLESARQTLANRARTHPWAVIALVATIPAIIFLRGLFSYLNIYFLQWAAIRAITDLRIRLFDHLINLSAGFFNLTNTGELMSRIISDTNALQGIISNATAVIVKDPATLIGLLAYLLYKQPKLTLISMIVMPLCVIPIIVYGRKTRRSAGNFQTHTAELSSVMVESFTGNRVIKAYNLEGTVTDQFRAVAKKLIGHYMRIVRAMEAPGPLMEFFGATGVGLVFLYLAFQTGNRTSYADFLGLLLAIFSMYRPFKNLARLHNTLEQARAASERVFELLATKSTIPEPAQPKPLKAAGADIEFSGIEFAFGEKGVLHNVNLTVKAGQFVGLVGATGSGKTTIGNLLLRFYDPQKGAVRIGGVDIRDVSSRDLRNHIAVVTQDTILFNDTIRRNIGLGRPGASDAQIEAAARHAHAHEFIVQKPQGYDTLIGEKGVLISGGQKQRIAIARAILRDVPILVLDEATSALDPEVERIVQAALEELMKGRTTICIAHRFSTIQRADVIVVLDQGRIVEMATHDQLLKQGGVYKRLYELQFQTTT
jgi:subfamily B ATP-binding cassette protein MsbA